MEKIKYNELRIGNWVMWNGPNSQEKALVCAISMEEIYFSCGDSGLIENIEGIPITEEWLLKHGHNKDTNELIYIDRFKLIWNDTYKFWYILDYESLGYITKVEYIHEWQNAFFALNGKELIK